jgi:hypothetical protein
MIPRNPTCQNLVTRPFATPRIVAVNRLDQLTSGESDEDLTLIPRLREHLRPSPGQMPQVRDGNMKIPRRRGNVAIVLRPRARDQGKVKMSYEATTGGPAVLVGTSEAFDLLAARRSREAAPA